MTIDSDFMIKVIGIVFVICVVATLFKTMRKVEEFGE